VHRANHQLDFLSHHIYYYIIGDIIVYVHLHSKGYRHAIVNFSKPFSIVYDPPPSPFSSTPLSQPSVHFTRQSSTSKPIATIVSRDSLLIH
jgi:hypothetical protein